MREKLINESHTHYEICYYNNSRPRSEKTKKRRFNYRFSNFLRLHPVQVGNL